MSSSEAAKKMLNELYNADDMSIVLEMMQIVNKYTTEEGRRLMDNGNVSALQQDGMTLVALNFYLNTLATNAEIEERTAYNSRKYQYSKNWVNIKESDPKMKQGELDQQAEVSIFEARNIEIQTSRKAKLLRSASDSAIEVSNMLKKVVERLLVQGQTHNG